jgi:hypothetical protein
MAVLEEGFLRLSLYIVVAAVVLAIPREAQAVSARCKSRCEKPKAAPDHELVEIDADTGRLLSGAAAFDVGDKLQLVFQNKNPFKYTYRFAIATQAADTERVTTYLAPIKFPAGAGVIPKLPSAGMTTLASGERSKPESCSTEGAKNWFATLSASAARISSAAPVLEEAAPFARAYSSLLEISDADRVIADRCEAVCQAAEDFVAVAAPTKTPDEIKKAADDFSEGLRPFLPANIPPAAQGQCAQDAIALFTPMIGPVDTAAKAAEAYKEVPAAVAAANDAKAQQLAANLLQDSNLFHESRYTTATSEPTVLRVDLYRKNLRQKDPVEQAVASLELRAGRGRVAISAGILMSALSYRHVIRQPSRGDDGTIVSKFQYDTDSEYTVTPAVLLNVRFLDEGWGYSWFPSMHATVGILSGATDGGNFVLPEFVAGGSFSLANDLIFITLAAHFGQRESLGGGFMIGEQVPTDLSDPLPVTRRWRSATALGVTFRFQ